MKNLVVVFVFCFSIIGFAQKDKYKSGNYIAQGKEKGFQLKLNQDNTYDFIFSSGNYEIKSDTIYFHNKFADEKLFEIEPSYENNDDSKLIFSFNYESLSYNYENIYLGIRNQITEEIEYKSFYTIIEENDIRDFYENEGFSEISIDKVDKIYLLVHGKNVKVYEYEIDKSISKLQITYISNNYSNLKLKGYYSKDNRFLISDGRNPIIFSLVNEENINPSKCLDFVNTFEDTKFIEKYSDSTEMYARENYENGQPEYKFKYKIENSLQESIKALTKTPNKFLVVFYDPKNKDIKTHFENFIEFQEEIVSRNMYDGYDENYDHYNYYLATEKDKKALHLKSDEAQVVFLNSDNQIVYFTNATIQNAENELFGYYSDINNELNKANTFAKIDKVVTNKKASTNEINEAFKLTQNLPSFYNNDYAVDSVAAVVEPMEYNFSRDEKNDLEKEAAKVVEEAARAVEAAVDSTANYDYSYYNGIKDKENLYQLKASKELVQAKWKQLFQAKKLDKKLDLDFIKSTIDELNRSGFSYKLFEEISSDLSKFDLEMLDFLIDRQVEVDSIKVIRTVEEEQESYGYEEKFSLRQRLNNFFSDFSKSKWDETKNENLIKLLPYYKKFIANQNNNYFATLQFINVLYYNFESLQNPSELYVAYENFYNFIINKDSSIIESLNDFYENVSNESNDPYYYLGVDWSSFKSQFSDLANSVAWNVVEKSDDVSLIQKAITWSEASLKIDKENHYYLDTLAQLYYKNGQKEKAIQTEEKAVFFAKKNEDIENVEEYENVLEKMKTGKY